MSSFVPLRYYLPTTVIGVRARIHYVVVFDELGGHLELRSDLEIAPRVTADRRARCTTRIEAGMLESNAFTVEFTANGLIGAIGTYTPGDPGGAPETTSRIGRASRIDVGPSAEADPHEIAQRATWTRPGALRAAFNRTHPRTAALIADLSARAEQFLAGMRMSDGPAEVETFGQALTIVERELAAADRMRREWVASQGFQVRCGSWELDLAQTVLRSDVTPPSRLPADTPVPGGDAAVLAEQYGALVVVFDPERARPEDADADLDVHRLERVDEILIRRSRPAAIVAYRRAPAGVGEPAEAAGEWVRDDGLTQHLDVVDGVSDLDVLAPHARVFGDRPLRLAFHSDGSLRAFGVAAETVPAGSGAVAGGVAAAGTVPGPDRAAVATAAIEAARLQLALLNASDEFTRLAATHAHGGELTTLEQDTRFATLRSQRP